MSEELRRLDAYWRACNYVAAGMIYLRDNPLLRETIREVQEEARARGKATRARWPMIVLRTPKGWTGPGEVDGHKVEDPGAPTKSPWPAFATTRSTWPSSRPGSRATRPRSCSTPKAGWSRSCVPSHRVDRGA